MGEWTEQCEYDPVRHAARYDGQGCTNISSVCLGANGKWHLCASCAALPEFNRYRSRHPLPNGRSVPIARAVLVAAMKDELPVLKQAVINAAIALVSINHTPNSKAGAELNLRKAVKALQSAEAEIAS